jgi:polyisoprenoid-binding protein YceI
VVSVVFYLFWLSARAAPLNVPHSEIAFEAESRLALARGVFRQWSFQGSVDGEQSRGEIRVAVCSLDTSNGMRDNHLKGPDFLDCARFPEAVFRLTGVQGSGASQISGVLTLKGIARPVVCPAESRGSTIRGHCVIDRRDFGISYQSALNPIAHNVKIVFVLRTD